MREKHKKEILILSSCCTTSIVGRYVINILCYIGPFLSLEHGIRESCGRTSIGSKSVVTVPRSNLVICLNEQLFHSVHSIIKP